MLAAELIAPDLMLPVQFAGMHRSIPEPHPLARLMFAVLEQAIEEFLAPRQTRHMERLRADAASWIFDLEARGVFSFHVICEVLNLSASALRVGLLRARARGLSYRPFDRPPCAPRKD